MADEDRIRAGLEALSQFFVSEGSFSATLVRVAELARDALGADMAGLTMLVEGRPRTGVFTDSAAPYVDEAQYSSGRGPCLEAFRTGEVKTIELVPDDDRWPEFADAAETEGILSTLSLPMTVRDERVGALNCYARRPAAFKDNGLAEQGLVFAAQAAVVLANAQAYWDARELAQHLDEAMRSRATIEQAKGLLMAAGSQSPEDAFAILVRASQRENRKLRDIAETIVRSAQDRRPQGSSEPARLPIN